MKQQSFDLQIVDSTLREGQQSIHPHRHDEGIVFTHNQQMEIARQLIDFGMDFIEVPSPVRSSASQKVAKAIIKEAQGTKTRVLVHSRCREEDILSALSLEPDGINLYFNFSHILRSDTLKKALQSIHHHIHPLHDMRGERPQIRFSIEDVFRLSPCRITTILKEVKSNIDRIGLPDTTGTARPDEVQRLIRRVRRLHPHLDIECHFHNDRGLAIANALSAIENGANYMSTTILGIGERTGIVPLSGLMAALNSNPALCSLIREKYALTLLPQMARRIADMLQSDIPLNLPLVGPSAFSHVAGVHADRQRKNPQAYQCLDPIEFGRKSRIGFASAVVGKASILERAEKLQIHLTEEQAAQIADSVRESAKQSGGITPEEVDRRIRETGGEEEDGLV